MSLDEQLSKFVDEIAEKTIQLAGPKFTDVGKLEAYRNVLGSIEQGCSLEELTQKLHKVIDRVETRLGLHNDD
ncbi:hypothetical protein [Vibrio phage JSF23]|jgi:hypothetical protein|uniref:Uncharacterized protein n=4 Tax=Icepovirus bengalense TaxID=2846603 RepID=A0A076G541_9CAUD|nr:hypothetical protein ViPhICP2p56 [Vibrio phage ICP2]ADX87804.1 hypothetical protein TU12-16_00255 [Vibrio phage ICP2_2006_A]AII27100.1 hypothetical protein ICP22011A_0056 [Vibrio phage ICP2_2011_A]ASV43753.1 hypothetical protein [Vibrio phage JSF23]ASV43849.1 hypothetical protein [Vibrio phage JSF27]ADX87738.1 hypothetical protein [Vibrio phage ICP2]